MLARMGITLQKTEMPKQTRYNYFHFMLSLPIQSVNDPKSFYGLFLASVSLQVCLLVWSLWGFFFCEFNLDS